MNQVPTITRTSTMRICRRQGRRQDRRLAGTRKLLERHHSKKVPEAAEAEVRWNKQQVLVIDCRVVTRKLKQSDCWWEWVWTVWAETTCHRFMIIITIIERTGAKHESWDNVQYQMRQPTMRKTQPTEKRQLFSTGKSTTPSSYSVNICYNLLTHTH